MTDGGIPEIVPATKSRWADVSDLLDGSGEQGCWCQAWRGLDTMALSGGKSRPELLREQMQGAPPAPGFLAYLDGVPVGWVGVGVRTEIPRLMSSRTGAPGVEAYPIDPEGRRVEVGAGFVGIASMFDEAGFRRVLVTSAHSGGLPRLLVRLDLEDC